MKERTLGKKLLPLVQLLPAAAVAGVVLLTLPRTAPVLAAVPERLTPAASSTVEEEPEEVPVVEETPPALPYADGVYVGSSRGYGGPVRVQVTMEEGEITDLQILSASHETAAFLKRAKRLLGMVMTEQTWEVDAVSEATYTSRGILGAIRNALTGEEVINPLPPKQETPPLPVVEEIELPSTYRDGVYTASAEGYGGPITVQVTVSGDAITDITIVDHAGESSSYFAKARRVVSAILEGGTTEVDTVSGATYSSAGILNAVRQALAKAANDPAQPTPEEMAEEIPTEELPDTVQAEELPAESETAAPSEQPEAAAPEDDWTELFRWAEELWQSVFPADSEAQPPESMPEEPDTAEAPAADSPEAAQPLPEAGEAASEEEPETEAEAE